MSDNPSTFDEGGSVCDRAEFPEMGPLVVVGNDKFDARLPFRGLMAILSSMFAGLPNRGMSYADALADSLTVPLANSVLASPTAVVEPAGREAASAPHA